MIVATFLSDDKVNVAESFILLELLLTLPLLFVDVLHVNETLFLFSDINDLWPQFFCITIFALAAVENNRLMASKYRYFIFFS